MREDNDELIRDIIRSKIKCFVNRRERAYKFILHSGHPIPDYHNKARAIDALRIQLNASIRWNLEAHLKWIQAMHDDIVVLLPYEFHDDPKQKKYREHIMHLLDYCRDLLNTKSQNYNGKISATTGAAPGVDDHR
jgi:hypothetical protein